jgi:hypothetical protein
MPKDNSKKSDKYRKPPTEYQFKKGASGNPAGRPPRKKPSGSSALGGGIENRVEAMVLDEAMRLVEVKEGNKFYKIPAVQALLRTMLNAAAKGNSKIGSKVLELFLRAEGGRAEAALKLLDDAAQIKETHIALFEEHERKGLEPPEIYPHPDDIIFDRATCEVTIDGPMSKEEAGARKVTLERAIKSMPRFLEAEAALEAAPSNSALREEFRELKALKEFLESEGRRNIRHMALKTARQALRPKNSAEPKAAEPKRLKPEPGRKQLKPKPTGPKNDTPEAA